MESRLRQKLAQFPTLKLSLKIILDLKNGEFIQAKNSLFGVISTFFCTIENNLALHKKVECNYCGWKGKKFYPHVTTDRVKLGEKCPNCHSIPRYRTLMYYLKNQSGFFAKKLKVLEVGPNRSLQKILEGHPSFDYISVDLKSPQAMIHMDVTDLQFEDKSFDFVFCISVMHYVPDDKKGFSELFRVLKPNGELLFGSGLNYSAAKTILHKPSANNCFTVRTYGRDVLKKFEECGFEAKVVHPLESIDLKEKERFGLDGIHLYSLKIPA